MVIYGAGSSNIADEELEKITNKIIDILSREHITHAVANMVLDNTKEKLQDALFRKDLIVER